MRFYIFRRFILLIVLHICFILLLALFLLLLLCRLIVSKFMRGAYRGCHRMPRILSKFRAGIKDYQYHVSLPSAS